MCFRAASFNNNTWPRSQRSNRPLAGSAARSSRHRPLLQQSRRPPRRLRGDGSTCIRFWSGRVLRGRGACGEGALPPMIRRLGPWWAPPLVSEGPVPFYLLPQCFATSSDHKIARSPATPEWLGHGSRSRWPQRGRRRRRLARRARKQGRRAGGAVASGGRLVRAGSLEPPPCHRRQPNVQDESAHGGGTDWLD